MGNKNYETPPDLFAQLDAANHFTLDAAASHENALCDLYCTPDGTFLKGFGKFHPGDGLSYSWAGYRVFCNPPYDRNIIKWVQKALHEEPECAFLLLPPSVDTEWFHLIMSSLPASDGLVDCLTAPDLGQQWAMIGTRHRYLAFMRGRLAFYRDGKPVKSPDRGNLLFVVHNTQ